MPAFNLYQTNSMTIHPLTRKLQNLYVAYAPNFDVSAYGGCRDEAINNFTDEIRQRRAGAEETGEEGK